MEAAQEELSPEEKLLRVIQGGDGKTKLEETEDAVTKADAPPEAAVPVQKKPEAVPPPAEPEPPVVEDVAEPEPPAEEELPAEEPVQEAPEPPAEEPGADEPAPEKPKLKLADPEPEPEPEPVAEAVVDADGEPEKDEAEPVSPPEAPDQEVKGPRARPARTPLTLMPVPAVASKQKRGQVGSHLRIVNRLLVVLVVALLCLCAFEIWAGASAPPSRPGTAGEWVPGVDVDRSALPDLVSVQGAYQSKMIWAVAEKEPEKTPDPRPRPEPGPAVDAVLKLIGLSAPPDAAPEDMVAVILDSRDGKMRFVKIGEELSFNGQAFEVESISPEQVILADGDEQLVIR